MANAYKVYPADFVGAEDGTGIVHIAPGHGEEDFVVGKEVLPHIPEDRIRDAIRECMRVSKGPIFFEVQCGTTPLELDYLCRWDGTHRIARPPEWWEAVFAELGYQGDVHYKVLVSEQDG